MDNGVRTITSRSVVLECSMIDIRWLWNIYLVESAVEKSDLKSGEAQAEKANEVFLVLVCEQ